MRPAILEGEVGHRLLSHLRLLIDEEAPLWEVPARSTIVTTDSIAHDGPWDAEVCSWVLLRWHKAGLIGVYRLAPDVEATDELAAREAYLTLERFERWRPGEPETHLFATERGATAPDNVWLSVLGDD